MSLYIIPGKTHSTKADGERYRRHHDLGPHPDIRPLDGRPVRERLDELERQIVQFERDFGVQARTIRQHCTAWAGYLEPVEVMARLGVRMEGNYFSGGYSRWRDPAPYAPFGGAMPMRFCWPDGRLIDVYQQHTQISDDIHFGAYEYSYYIAPGAYSDMVRRILGDVCTRLHTPYAVCMHPSNWVRFSGDQGREQLRQAGERGLPIWSFDQWLDWWEARATRELTARWGDGVLRFEVAADTPCVGLRLMLPREFDGRRLGEVQVAGAPASTGAVTRWGRELVWVEVPAADGFAGTATYG
jgi:hypothetical protein